MEKVKILGNGYLRIPEEMLPEGKRPKFFSVSVAVNATGTRLVLTPSAIKNGAQFTRKALFTNKNAKSPYISIRKLLGVLGIGGKGQEVEVRKLATGSIEVIF